MTEHFDRRERLRSLAKAKVDADAALMAIAIAQKPTDPDALIDYAILYQKALLAAAAANTVFGAAVREEVEASK